jgi:quinol monooxygenase YgiN
MIVVVGRVQTDPDKRSDFVRIGQALVAASRADAGCLSYHLYEDSETANDFVFVEEWEDGEALERHFATPHIDEFMRAVPATVVAPPDVKFHTIASTKDLAEMSAR